MHANVIDASILVIRCYDLCQCHSVISFFLSTIEPSLPAGWHYSLFPSRKEVDPKGSFIPSALRGMEKLVRELVESWSIVPCVKKHATCVTTPNRCLNPLRPEYGEGQEALMPGFFAPSSSSLRQRRGSMHTSLEDEDSRGRSSRRHHRADSSRSTPTHRCIDCRLHRRFFIQARYTNHP